MLESVWSLLGMLAVAVLILVLAHLATKWIAAHGTGGFSGRALAGGSETFCVLGQISVGRNERIILMRLQERCYLLGVTEHSITLLKGLEGDEAKEWLTAEEKPAPPRFMDVLADNLRKRK